MIPPLPSLVDQSKIQCLVLCVVDTAILVLSAGEQIMHSVGKNGVSVVFNSRSR